MLFRDVANIVGDYINRRLNQGSRALCTPGRTTLEWWVGGPAGPVPAISGRGRRSGHNPFPEHLAILLIKHDRLGLYFLESFLAKLLQVLRWDTRGARRHLNKRLAVVFRKYAPRSRPAIRNWQMLRVASEREITAAAVKVRVRRSGVGCNKESDSDWSPALGILVQWLLRAVYQ
jgi:hypothetical protein